MPGRQHVDPSSIPDLLPYLWLLDVQHEPFRLRYRLVGTRIVEISGRELTGLWLDETHPHIVGNPNYLERYKAVVRSRIPSRRRGKPTLFLVHKDFIEIENAFFPLAADGATVDMILACTVFPASDGAAF